MTLIELLVAQVIVAIVIAGVFALVAAQTRTYHQGWSANEAQVRLREATHVMLRELQGLGGEDGISGDLVSFVDGGATGSDSLTLFLRDFSICSGVLPVGSVSGVNLVFDNSQDLSDPPDGTNDCPIGTLPGCDVTDLEGRTFLIRGGDHGARLEVTNASASSCHLVFNSGTENDPNIAAYDAAWGTSWGNSVPNLLSDLGGVEAIVFGSSMTFSIDDSREMLQRSVNGAAPVDVLPRVSDLQVSFAHDLNGNDLIDSGEWNSDNTLAGATPLNFHGVRFGLVTYASAGSGAEGTPPSFGNRDLSSLPSGRRYRYSMHFAASRNR